MPSFVVEKSISVNKEKAALLSVLSNFHEWRHWSPWLVLEPDATLHFSDEQAVVGATYSWEGELVGKGEMAIRTITEHGVQYDLTFIKPFSSHARVEFLLQEHAHATTVTWRMDGSLPWFMFWLKKMMVAMIGMDFNRGLVMLKEYMQQGHVDSALTINTADEIPALQYIGLRRHTKFSDIAAHMQEDFTTLYDYVRSQSIACSSAPFSMTETFKLVRGDLTYVVAIPYDGNIEKPEAPFFLGVVPHSAAVCVTHTGAYHHLGNAWGLLMQYARKHKLRIAKKPMGYEFYMNDPQNTPPEALVTKVCAALK